MTWSIVAFLVGAPCWILGDVVIVGLHRPDKREHGEFIELMSDDSYAFYTFYTRIPACDGVRWSLLLIPPVRAAPWRALTRLAYPGKPLLDGALFSIVNLVWAVAFLTLMSEPTDLIPMRHEAVASPRRRRAPSPPGW